MAASLLHAAGHQVTAVDDEFGGRRWPGCRSSRPARPGWPVRAGWPLSRYLMRARRAGRIVPARPAAGARLRICRALPVAAAVAWCRLI